jgi:hypothetical protein
MKEVVTAVTPPLPWTLVFILLLLLPLLLYEGLAHFLQRSQANQHMSR